MASDSKGFGAFFYRRCRQRGWAVSADPGAMAMTTARFPSTAHEFRDNRTLILITESLVEFGLYVIGDTEINGGHESPPSFRLLAALASMVVKLR